LPKIIQIQRYYKRYKNKLKFISQIQNIKINKVNANKLIYDRIYNLI